MDVRPTSFGMIYSSTLYTIDLHCLWAVILLILDAATVYQVIGLGIPHWLTTIWTLIMTILKPIHDALTMINMRTQAGRGIVILGCCNIRDMRVSIRSQKVLKDKLIL